MLIALIAIVSTAYAADPFLRITFTNARGAPCALALEPSPLADGALVVTELRVPGLPRGTAEVRTILNRTSGGLGDAHWLTPESAGRYVEDVYDAFFEDVLHSTSPAYADARARIGGLYLEYIREGLRFTRGYTAGRAVKIRAVTPVRARMAIQGQSILLLMPDAIYPIAIVAGVDGSTPTWSPLLNLRSPDRAQLLYLADVTELTRGPSYKLIRPGRTSTYVDDGNNTIDRE